jgi:hypothetical protein
MTSGQINEARDKAMGEGASIKAQRKATRLYDEQLARCWLGTVRAKPPYGTKFHYEYQSALLRDIADLKDGKQARRYYNRQAAKLEEKARGTVG